MITINPKQQIVTLFLTHCLFIGLCSSVYADYKIVDNFITDGFNPSLQIEHRADKISAYLAARFGKPLSTDTKISLDLREPGRQKEFKTLKFNGITIKTVTPFRSDELTPRIEPLILSDKLSTWITYISLTTDKYKLKHDLKIGSSKESFLKVLGKPGGSPKIFLSYSTWAVAPGNVCIDFDNSSKAIKITWEYYAD